jgi:hypothetical protein
MHYFSNLFWYRILHVSDRFTIHQQESGTVYTAMGICRTGYVDCLLTRSGIVHLVVFYYKNMSRCTFLWISKYKTLRMFYAVDTELLNKAIKVK